MKINVYTEPLNSPWAFSHVFHNFYEMCKTLYTEIEFELKNSLEYRNFSLCSGPNCKYGPFYMILENDITKKYILISYWDTLKNVIDEYDVTLWDVENCVDIITSAGVQSDVTYYKQTNYKYTPFSYVVNKIESEYFIEQKYASTIKTYNDKLFFRGSLYNFRSYLKNDSRFIIKDIHLENLSMDDYIKEIAYQKVSLSLNGAAEVCHRDIEIMGTGSTLFREKLITRFHNELVPDYHYIAVDASDLKNICNPDEYFKSLANRYYERFEEIKNNYDFVHFVGENGRQWYLQNGTVNANVSILKKLVNFEKLI